MIRPFLALICAAALLASLAACGRRPSVMDPPEGSDAAAYPRSYPDTALDPPGHYTPPGK